MSERNIYYQTERSILCEIAKEKKLFSFRNIIRLITANSIAKKL